MVSIIMLIGSSYSLGLTDIDVDTYAGFFHLLGLLTVTLFGSFAALTLDKLS